MSVCKACGSAVREFDRGRVLDKYDVRFDRCDTCGFVQTEAPYWLTESYSSAISDLDLGSVDRPSRYAPRTQALIEVLFRGRRLGRYVDYGAGYGIFVRMMRDRGYDFRWYDKYCQNLFARGFEARLGAESYDLLTAFEVFEHLTDPASEVREMVQLSSSVFFTTELLPDPTPPVSEWWYYGLLHGQHVAFYTPAALRAIAGRLGLRFITNGRDMHLMTRQPIRERAFRLLLRPQVARLVSRVRRRPSLLGPDALKAQAAAAKRGDPDR
jgi:hypothetical protein